MPEREQAAINPAPVVADLQQRTAAGIDHHPGRVGIVEAAPPHGEKGAFECPIRALAFLDWVQASPPRQGFGPVQVAGDPERRMRVERSEQGVPVDAITWHEILAAAGRLGVDGGEVQRLAIGWVECDSTRRIRPMPHGFGGLMSWQWPSCIAKAQPLQTQSSRTLILAWTPSSRSSWCLRKYFSTSLKCTVSLG